MYTLTIYLALYFLPANATPTLLSEAATTLPTPFSSLLLCKEEAIHVRDYQKTSLGEKGLQEFNEGLEGDNKFAFKLETECSKID